MRKFLVVTICTSSLLGFAPGAWASGWTWTHVGNGGVPGTASLNGAVTALHADGTDLYVGGAFTDAGGVASADFVAKWNGTAWSGLAPLNGNVNAIAFAGGRLFVGGAFTDASGNPNADFLAAWNGSAWEPFCTSVVAGPAFTGSVYALQVIGNTLYVGGAFTNGAGIAAADYLVGCDLTTGTANSTVDSVVHSFNGAVSALTADASGTLYAGGVFINLEGIPAADYVAAYDGGGVWRAMGSGSGVGGGPTNAVVRALASDGTNVYVGTDAVNVAGIAAADHVVRWNGSAWSAMGPSYFPDQAIISALAVDGPFVFAGGSFQDADGDAFADAIAYWDGLAWHSLGSDGAGNGPLSNTTALATLGAHVFAGGNFTSAGGDTLARFIAQSPIAPIVIFIDGFEL